MKYRNKIIITVLVILIIAVNAFTVKHIFDYNKAKEGSATVGKLNASSELIQLVSEF